jgi:hypothetical protein
LPYKNLMKKLRSFLLIVCCLAWACCNNSNRHPTKREGTIDNKKAHESDSAKREEIRENKNMEAYDASFVLANYLVKNAPANDMQVLDSDAAIFIAPDSVQVEELKKEDGEDNFYTAADDAQYYQGEDMELFDSLKVKVIAPHKRYIKFISRVKTVYFDTRSKAALGWTTVLFRTDSLPKIVNSVDLYADSAMHCYFKRK